MKKLFLLSVLLALTGLSVFATIRIVDKNGGGQYLTIQAGINAAATNDTVIVWPGTYTEQITLNKNIVLQGSGYENTIINGNYSPLIKISMGKIRWFFISSQSGNGIQMNGPTAIVSNCVVYGCANSGIYSDPDQNNGYIYNTLLINNANWGIEATSGYIWVINCIASGNAGGYYGNNYYGCQGRLNIGYSNGSLNCTSNNQGCIDLDPGFLSLTDYHISPGSPCWDKGHPALKDPDGSRSDMGYFGGPDAPIYPVVYEITTSPNGNNINIQAKARANY